MKKPIKGLIFGNDKKQCQIEMLNMLMSFAHSVEIVSFRKIKDKDLFEYKCIVDI